MPSVTCLIGLTDNLLAIWRELTKQEGFCVKLHAGEKMSLQQEDETTTKEQTNPFKLREFACLGRSHTLSQSFLKPQEPTSDKEPSSSSTQQQEPSYFIDWKLIPKFEPLQKLDYSHLLDDYSDFVRDLKKLTSLSSTQPTSIDSVMPLMKNIQSQHERLVQTSREFFETHPSYFGGDIHKQFLQVMDCVERLQDLTLHSMEERVKGDLLFARLSEKGGSSGEQPKARHVKLVEQVLREHVAWVKSRVELFEELCKNEFEPKMNLLRRVDKHSL